MGWFRKSKQKAEDTGSKTNIWAICSSCKAHIYKEEWNKSGNICPKCNFHEKITCKERLEILIDKDTYQEIAPEVTTSDPLNFSDGKGTYASKAEIAKTKTGLKESIIAGTGKINGMRVVIAIMDFRFLGGSLGSGTGEKILRACQYSLKHKLPCIILSASGGARMHEGIISLMQMAKTCACIAQLNKANIPYISVLTHPTTGGVSASYAMMGDVNITEPGVMIAFAGRRVIEETIKQKLPDDFQTAEYLLEHGFIDAITPRSEMKDLLHQILQYWNQG